jgi:hypothetical protein
MSKGGIPEGLMAKRVAESPKGAGQYFPPRTDLGDRPEAIGGHLLGAHDHAVEYFDS